MGNIIRCELRFATVFLNGLIRNDWKERNRYRKYGSSDGHWTGPLLQVDHSDIPILVSSFPSTHHLRTANDFFADRGIISYIWQILKNFYRWVYIPLSKADTGIDIGNGHAAIVNFATVGLAGLIRICHIIFPEAALTNILEFKGWCLFKYENKILY